MVIGKAAIEFFALLLGQGYGFRHGGNTIPYILNEADTFVDRHIQHIGNGNLCHIAPFACSNISIPPSAGNLNRCVCSQEREYLR